MNKCDKSENQLFDSMIRFIKNGVLLVRDPHLAAKVAIIPKKWKSFGSNIEYNPKFLSKIKKALKFQCLYRSFYFHWLKQS